MNRKDNKKAGTIFLALSGLLLSACVSTTPSSSSGASSDPQPEDPISSEVGGSSSTVSEESESSSSSTSSESEELGIGAAVTIDGITYQRIEGGFSVTSFGNDHTEVSVPAEIRGLPVVSVMYGAGRNSPSVTKLELPSSITTLVTGAFAGMYGLETLIVPFVGSSRTEGLSLGDLFLVDNVLMYMAYGSLKNIEIYDQTAIPGGCCQGITSIEKVTVRNAKSIGNGAFMNTSTTEAILGDGLETLNIGAFSTTKLKTLELPDSVTTIDYQAFYRTQLTEITIPNSLVTFNFSNDINTLTSFTTGEDCLNFTAVDGILYNKDITKVVCFPAHKDATGYSLPATVTEIGNNAFRATEKDTGENAYNDGVGTLSLDFSNIEVIGDHAFEESSLVSATLSSKLREIGEYAFAYSYGLTSVDFADTTEGEGLTLGDYAFTVCINLASITLPDYITAIPVGCFSNCGKLATIVIEGEIASIGFGAFRAADITEIEITFADAATLGGAIFENCDKLTDFYVHFATGVTTYPTFTGVNHNFGVNPRIIVDDEATADALKVAWTEMAGAISLDASASFLIDDDGNLSGWTPAEGEDLEAIIPDGTKTIKQGAFSAAANVRRIVIPASVTTIEWQAFGSSTVNRNMILVEFLHEDPSTITFQRNNGTSCTFNQAFNNNTAFHVGVPDGCVSAYTSAGWSLGANRVHESSDLLLEDDILWSADKSTLYKGAAAVTEVTLDERTKTIASTAFYNRTNLTSINLDYVETIGSDAFSYSGLEEVTIGENCTTIGEYAFMCCESLTSISILGPAEICSGAFSEIYNVQSIDLGDQIVSIGDYAFKFACPEDDAPAIEVIIPSTVANISDSAFDLWTGNSDSIIWAEFTEAYSMDFDYGLDWADYAGCNVYFYSEDGTDADSYQAWHYVDGVPTLW